MKYFRVRNWKKFQHYSSRAPIWIRLYTDGIEDEAGDWASWTDLQRGHITGIWQLAAKMNNCMPFDNGLVSSEIMATEQVNLESFGDHFQVYQNKRDCLASGSASNSASDIARGISGECSSPSLSRSSSSECVSTKKHNFAVALLSRHGISIPANISDAEADKIIDTLKDQKVRLGARAPADFPDDPDLTPEERAASTAAMAAAKGAAP